jgi:hypothetical protein
MLKFLVPLMILLPLANTARAEQPQIDRIVSKYTMQCHDLQAKEIIPFIDEDLEPPTIFDPEVTLAPEDIYQIDLTSDGKKATILVADFDCPGFGSLGCGVTGSCTSFIIVGGQVFEWSGGGRPVSAMLGDTVIVASSTGGFLCDDSDGGQGFGAAPCYVAAAWDDKQNKFWSQDKLVWFRSDLSAP